MARHRAEQRALAHAAAAEDSDALALAAGQQAVDRANAGDQRLRNMLAVERISGRPVEIVERLGWDGAAGIERMPKAVEHAPQQRRPHRDPRVAAARDDGIAQLHAARFFERHREDPAVAEAHHLRPDQACRRPDLAEIAHRRAGPLDSR